MRKLLFFTLYFFCSLTVSCGDDMYHEYSKWDINEVQIVSNIVEINSGEIYAVNYLTTVLGYSRGYNLKLNSDNSACKLKGIRLFPVLGKENQFHSVVGGVNVPGFQGRSEPFGEYFQYKFEETVDASTEIMFEVNTKPYGMGRNAFEVNEYFDVKVVPLLVGGCEFTGNLEVELIGKLADIHLEPNNVEESSLRNGRYLVGSFNVATDVGSNNDKLSGELLSVVITSVELQFNASKNLLLEELYLLHNGEVVGKVLNESVSRPNNLKIHLNSPVWILGNSSSNFTLEGAMKVTPFNQSGYSGTEMSLYAKSIKYQTSLLNGNTYEYGPLSINVYSYKE